MLGGNLNPRLSDIKDFLYPWCLSIQYLLFHLSIFHLPLFFKGRDGGRWSLYPQGLVWHLAHSRCFVFCWMTMRCFERNQILPWLPCWLSSKESVCQCRRSRFDPWVGKIPWRRKWQPTPILWPGEYQGQRSLVDCNPCGQKESAMTEHWALWGNSQKSLYFHSNFVESVWKSIE